MIGWNMLTVVGADRPGIVARLTETLYRNHWNLGEASMLRLGGNFTIMMMVGGEGDLFAEVKHLTRELGLRIHVDTIRGELHQHVIPNLQVRVLGSDRAGIVAQVTAVLARNGVNILELESDVAGSADKPLYIMNIQGYSKEPLDELEQELGALVEKGMEVKFSQIETMVG